MTGSQEPGETLAETATRELAEETGIDAGALRRRRRLAADRTSTRSTRSGGIATRPAPRTTPSTCSRSSAGAGAGDARAARAPVATPGCRGRKRPPKCFSWSNRAAIETRAAAAPPNPEPDDRSPSPRHSRLALAAASRRRLVAPRSRLRGAPPRDRAGAVADAPPRDPVVTVSASAATSGAQRPPARVACAPRPTTPSAATAAAEVNARIARALARAKARRRRSACRPPATRRTRSSEKRPAPRAGACRRR